MKRRREEPRQESKGGGGGGGGAGAGAGASDLVIDDEFKIFIYNDTQVRFGDLFPHEYNVEAGIGFPPVYTNLDDDFRITYVASLNIIRIEDNNVTIIWPGRFWPRMKPILDALKKPEDVRYSVVPPGYRFEGGRSRKRRRLRSRSKRY